MPLYYFECPDCGRQDCDVRSAADADDPQVCDCGAAMDRDYSLEMGDKSTTGVFHKPVELFSVGMSSDEEINDFRKRCPGVDISSNPDDELYGVPIARTRKQKLAALDAMGFQEIR